MTLDEIQKAWTGRKIYSSTDHRLDGKPPTKLVERIWHNSEDGMYYAWADEHHRANTAEALDRRLHSLAPR